MRSDTDKVLFVLIKHLQRENLTPYDEAVAVAKLVDLTSPQEAMVAWRRPKAWISKRVTIAKAPDFVTDFAAGDTTGDGEALYELAKFASDHPGQARKFIENFPRGGHLRARLRAAQRQDPNPTDEGDRRAAASKGAGDCRSAGGERNLSRSARPAEDHAREDEGDIPDVKWPASSKSVDVKRVLRRAGQIVLVTPQGMLRANFSAQAKEQFAKLLGG